MSKSNKYTTFVININASVGALFEEIRKELQYTSLNDLIEDSLSFFLSIDTMMRCMGIYHYHVLSSGADEDQNRVMSDVRVEALLLFRPKLGPSTLAVTIKDPVFRGMAHFLKTSFGVEEALIASCMLMFRWCMNEYDKDNIVVAYGEHFATEISFSVPLINTLAQYDRNLITFEAEEDDEDEYQGADEVHNEEDLQSDGISDDEEVWGKEPLDSDENN